MMIFEAQRAQGRYFISYTGFEIFDASGEYAEFNILSLKMTHSNGDADIFYHTEKNCLRISQMSV